MKTIRFEKLDPETPAPTGNPISLHSMDEHSMVFGDIRVVRTGIRLYTSDTFRVVEVSVPGISMLGAEQDEYNDFKVTVLCHAMSVRLTRMQKFAIVTLYEMKPMPLRFAEFSHSGTRLVAGEPKDIQHG